MEDIREVDFYTYCPKCKNEEKKEIEEPCNVCLSITGRMDSEKPEFFKEKEGKETKKKP